jgi:hypothetical protein
MSARSARRRLSAWADFSGSGEDDRRQVSCRSSVNPIRTRRRIGGVDGVRFRCRRTACDPRRSCLVAPCDRAGGGEVAAPNRRWFGRDHGCVAYDNCARRHEVPDGPRFQGVAGRLLCLATQRPGGSRSDAEPVHQSAPGHTREVRRRPLRLPLKGDKSARLRAGGPNPRPSETSEIRNVLPYLVIV